MINKLNNQLKNLNVSLQKRPKFFFVLPALISSVLCFTSYPPFPAWAIFFCFVPVWNQWFTLKNLKHTLISAFICQFLITLGGFYWVAHTAWEFGKIPIPLNILVMLLFCCISNLHIVFAALVAHFVKIKLNLRPAFYFVTVAVLYAFFEYIWPSIFPWNLGYPLLFSGLKTAQLAEFVGFNILSLFVLLLNSLFAMSFYRFPQKAWSDAIILFLVLLGLSEFLGQLTLKKLPLADKSSSIAIVQTNMGSFEKYWKQYGQNFQLPIINKLFELTENVVKTKKPDLVVWPENAFPTNLDSYYLFGAYQQNLIEFIKKNNINLITGGFSQSEPSAEGNIDYSGLFLFNSNGELKGTYRKHILLAFGEYIPGSNYFPFLKKLIPEVSEIGRGIGPSMLSLNGLNITPVICYEAIYPNLVTSFSNMGSHIIVNITNDSWYGDFSEQQQHFIMSVARSVELRKPQVRATNTGYSAVSDASGKVIVKSPLNQEWAQIVNVPYYSVPIKTLFSKIESYLAYIFSLLVLLIFLIDIISHVKKRT
ncbi:MAG: apolipoprotein N-acyltransferase [Oligoflexia bacterium]|nr:apolipoprotein N-acyltransferase [Oligoflexia bacterium]